MMATSLDLQYVAKEIVELSRKGDFEEKTLAYSAEFIVTHIMGSSWKDENKSKFKELSSIVTDYLIAQTYHLNKWKLNSKIMAKEINDLIYQNIKISTLSKSIYKEAILKKKQF